MKGAQEENMFSKCFVLIWVKHKSVSIAEVHDSSVYHQYRCMYKQFCEHVSLHTNYDYLTHNIHKLGLLLIYGTFQSCFSVSNCFVSPFPSTKCFSCIKTHSMLPVQHQLADRNHQAGECGRIKKLRSHSNKTGGVRFGLFLDGGRKWRCVISLHSLWQFIQSVYKAAICLYWQYWFLKYIILYCGQHGAAPVIL